jgi:hypothetical protein
MSTEPTSGETDGGDTTLPASPPPAPDRPLVDGTHKTSDELRAELDQLLEEDRQRAAEPAGEPAGPPSARSDGSGTGPSDGAARTRDGAVSRVQHQVERARTAVPGTASTVTRTVQEKASALRQAVPAAVQEKAASARDTAQERPGVLAAVAAALVLVLLVRRVLKGR